MRRATQPAQTPSQRQRADAAPKPPDLEKVVREIKDLRMQDKAIEARIQALAADDAEFERDADEKAEAWQRARVADLEARDRVRRGKCPTSERGELAFELGMRRKPASQAGSRQSGKMDLNRRPSVLPGRGESILLLLCATTSSTSVTRDLELVETQTFGSRVVSVCYQRSRRN